MSEHTPDARPRLGPGRRWAQVLTVVFNPVWLQGILRLATPAEGPMLLSAAEASLMTLGPTVFYVAFIRRKAVVNRYALARRLRHMPFLVNVVCLVAALMLRLAWGHAGVCDPATRLLLYLLGGNLVGWAITRFRRPSLHMMGWGAGGWLTLVLLGMPPLYAWPLFVALGAAIAWARHRLLAHSWREITWGSGLGLLSLAVWLAAHPQAAYSPF